MRRLFVDQYTKKQQDLIAKTAEQDFEKYTGYKQSFDRYFFYTKTMKSISIFEIT